MKKESMKTVSVVVPTYKRPEDIKRALKSLLQQNLEGLECDIVVADNDPAGSAKDAVMRIAQNSPVKITYVHAPEPGVSNARNSALAQTGSPFIAFLDDDMTASENWVSELVKASEKYQTAITFGPAIAEFNDPTNPINSHVKLAFSRTMEAEEGLTNELFGTGGCLINLNLCEFPSPPFDPNLNQTGGEDDVLFANLIAQGGKIGWAPKAKSTEHVPADRVTRDYIWKRHFSYGQGPSQSEADKGFAGSLGVAFWMCVGAAQTLIYGPVYLVMKALKKPSEIRFFIRLAEGLGKMLWWGGFSPRLYGAASKEA